MSLGCAASVALMASVHPAGSWARVSTPFRHYFSTYITTTDQYHNLFQHAVLGLSE